MSCGGTDIVAIDLVCQPGEGSRTSEWHSGGRRFDPGQLHQIPHWKSLGVANRWPSRVWIEPSTDPGGRGGPASASRDGPGSCAQARAREHYRKARRCGGSIETRTPRSRRSRPRPAASTLREGRSRCPVRRGIVGFDLVEDAVRIRRVSLTAEDVEAIPDDGSRYPGAARRYRGSPRPRVRRGIVGLDA